MCRLSGDLPHRRKSAGIADGTERRRSEMTHQEKEALLKRIYALPTGWADGGGSYGEGGPVGSEDAAMLWPEDVIDAINQFADDTNVARSPWVKTSDRLPTEADADEEGRIPVLAVGIFTGRLIKMTVHYKVVSANTEGIKYFLPIPLLPEEENE